MTKDPTRPVDPSAPPRRRGPRLGALSEWVDACLAPVLAKQGFAASDVIVAWPEIVGEKLARFCEPVKMQWPRRAGAGAGEGPQEPATLVVRTESAFALELQHMAPVLVERINARYGWRCVGRITLRQGPVGRDRMAPPRLREPAPADMAAAAQRVGEVEDEGLREALIRLGAGVLSRSRS